MWVDTSKLDERLNSSALSLGPPRLPPIDPPRKGRFEGNEPENEIWAILAIAAILACARYVDTHVIYKQFQPNASTEITEDIGATSYTNSGYSIMPPEWLADGFRESRNLPTNSILQPHTRHLRLFHL